MADNDVTRIAGNIGAMNALYSLQNINKQLSIHQTRLATGKRINSAADDPAGLAISTKMMARSEGLKTALSNIGDAKNLLAVAESGLGRLNDILIQMRNKAEAAASETMGSAERLIVKDQLAAYSTQIDDIVNQTKWNSVGLLDGSKATWTFQTGADVADTSVLTGLVPLYAENLGLMQAAGVSGVAGFVAAATSGITAADADATATGVFAGTGWEGMTELASGDYKVRVTGTDDGDGNVEGFTVQLWHNGSIVQVDADGVDGGEVANAHTNTDATTGTVDVYFGNGLFVTVDVDALSVGLNGVQDITYTRGGTTSVAVGAGDRADYASYMSLV
jgi:flagellin-like hook-associated protein FlgL